MREGCATCIAADPTHQSLPALPAIPSGLASRRTVYRETDQGSSRSVHCGVRLTTLLRNLACRSRRWYNHQVNRPWLYLRCVLGRLTSRLTSGRDIVRAPASHCTCCSPRNIRATPAAHYGVAACVSGSIMLSRLPALPAGWHSPPPGARSDPAWPPPPPRSGRA